MNVWAAGRCALVASSVVLGGHAAAAAPLTGDQLLARAATIPGCTSYAVPVEFDVHVHKPIGVRVRVEGKVSYRAPGDAALVITKAPAIVGGFFKGSYHLDVVPQAWPARYHVTGVSHAAGAAPVTVLTALPKSGAGTIARVTFRIDDRTRALVAASWLYTDGSTIALTFVNARLGAAMVPQTATIAVDMPTSKIEATATYGTYVMNGSNA